MDTIDHPKNQKDMTPKQRQYLIDAFPNTDTKIIAEKLKLTREQVYNKAYWLGLKKDKEYMEKLIAREAAKLRILGENCRFQKGHTPANKGQKMSTDLYEKVKPTMFKKGHTPHNAKYDGHERITKDGYIEIRIRLGKYILKHRHLWEQHNGKIPKGMIIVFKDKNKLNCTIENLEIITKAENMRRNTVHRYPEEIKNTIKILTKLKKKINEKQD
jgi:hypothetical protein